MTSFYNHIWFISTLSIPLIKSTIIIHLRSIILVKIIKSIWIWSLSKIFHKVIKSSCVWSFFNGQTRYISMSHHSPKEQRFIECCPENTYVSHNSFHFMSMSNVLLWYSYRHNLWHKYNQLQNLTNAKINSHDTYSIFG